MTYLHPDPLTFHSQRLAGRVVVVTGASSGIGEAAVSLFAREGAIVIAAARRTEQLQSQAKTLTASGLNVFAYTCDVSDEASVQSMISDAVRDHGRIDGAFNNAGIGGVWKALHETPTDRFDAVIATNLRGVFVCMKYEIEAMLKTGGGAIVNTSSIGGLVGGAGNSAYAASKWGLAGLTKCAALDYARRSIRVNAIAPGATRTPMLDRWLTSDAAREQMAANFPMNYIAAPDDMARAALFLLSDEARWTTGTVFPCEGGASAD
jgi:NAD(P)-dependent dehydrogenase (short-subunit alcohol dehydrogenase family)